MRSAAHLNRVILTATTLLRAALLTGCGEAAGVNVGQSIAAVTLSGYEVVSQETATDSTSSKQLQVQCPSGKKALGAGWAVLDGTGAILDGLATHSSASWDGSSWLTNAKKLSTFASTWKLKVSVLCGAQGLSGYELVSAETPVNSTATKQLSLSCPSGKSATGAGWGVLDGTGGILDGEALHFMPSWNGASWLTNARNNSGFAPSWKLKGQVICVHTSALTGYTVVTSSTATNNVPSKQVNLACPSGKSATGAGWAVLDGTGAILDGAATHSLPSWNGATWLTNAKNSSGGFAPNWQLSARALCVN